MHLKLHYFALYYVHNPDRASKDKIKVIPKITNIGSWIRILCSICDSSTESGSHEYLAHPVGHPCQKTPKIPMQAQ